MANWYVYSGAAGTASGADWANAKTTLAAAITAGAAGDTYYVAHDHAESNAGTLTITLKGTSANPDRVICVNRSGSVPPVSADLRTTATITQTNTADFFFRGYGYVYGLTLYNNPSGAGGNLIIGQAAQNLLFENCVLRLGANTTAGHIQFVQAGTGNQAGRITLKNTNLQFGAVGQSIVIQQDDVLWLGGALAGTAPTTLIVQGSASMLAGRITLVGVDLSLSGSGKTLVGAIASAVNVAIINCKLGASVTIAASPTDRGGGRTDLMIADSGTANYRQERYRYEGTLTAETIIVPAAQQASDGTTPITWKVVTGANAKWIGPFESFPYVEWIDTTGAAVTRTFEIVNDGTTLTDAEVWAEAEYLGSGATPVASLASSSTADVLAAGTNLTSSSVTWTTTGLASPVKQKIAVTFTPQMKGYFRIVFKFARASKTVYLNPRPNEV